MRKKIDCSHNTDSVGNSKNSSFLASKCTPENIVYGLDYQNKRQDSNYYQIFKDYGWEYEILSVQFPTIQQAHSL